MAITTRSVIVGTSATQLTLASADMTGGSGVMMRVPAGGVVVYVGGAAVTTGTGMPVDPGDAFADDLDDGEVLYGVVAAGTQAVNVYQRGV